jgi:hypothetical protein
MATYTRPEREKLILEAMSEASERGQDLGRAGHDSVPALSNDLYQETLLALVTDGYLDSVVMTTAADRSTVIPRRLLPKGRRAVGQWPSENVELELIRALDRLEETENDPERKGRFARLRAGFVDVGIDVFAKVVTEAAKSFGGRVI